MSRNCVISNQATPWLKKSILRRPFVKYYYLLKSVIFLLIINTKKEAFLKLPFS